MAEERARPRPPRSVQLVTIFSFLLLYIPLAALVIYSFLATNLQSGMSYFTWDWYRRAFSNAAVLASLGESLKVAFGCTLGSTLIGTSVAIALSRHRFAGRSLLNVLIHIPLIMPEIVLGLALLIWFVALRITLGTFSIVLAHVTFSVSYVIITVQARLKDFDRTLEEAAQDLGASPWNTFWHVTFPLIWPGILSGALLAFTLSFDDFLITFFTAGVGSDTLPLKVYAMIKFGVTPEINALSTAMLAVTFVLVLAFYRPLLKSSGMKVVK